MQQENNLQKQQELNTLEELIRNGCSEKDPGSGQLTQLCFKYPYHYIQLIKKIGRMDTPPDSSLFVKAYVYACRLTNNYYRKLQRHLVLPPQNEKEQVEFDREIEVFEDLILRQIRDN